MANEVPKLIDSAPKDNTLVRLWVRGGTNRLEDVADDELWETIGSNNFENNDIDEWDIVGWDWCHDFFTESKGGVVVAWAGLLPVFKSFVLRLEHDRKARYEEGKRND